MDVELLVYDLSHGLARQLSLGMLGFQLEAVYHTSILIEGLEYVYQQSIRVVQPGAFSGFGTPIEKIPLGRTELPHEVIVDYLNLVKARFTAEAYNLFSHNCNTFTDEFANFLLGKGIPHHITNMPQAVLNTPFGVMLQRQLGGMSPVGDPIPEGSNPETMAAQVAAPLAGGSVKTVSDITAMGAVLASASESFAVVFFTSATCPPCKLLYSLYDELAREAGDKGVLVKVDISHARDIASQYSISSTPTFITFTKNKQQERWSGADTGRLKGTIHLLVQMAHHPHPHRSLSLPYFFAQSAELASYTKVPPMSKLVAKLGLSSSDPAVLAAKDLIESASKNEEAPKMEAIMETFADWVKQELSELPREVMFAAVDLLRCTLVVPGTADFLVSRKEGVIEAILGFVNRQAECPYALRLVTLHMACNLGKSPLFANKLLQDYRLRSQLIQLVTTSLLDEVHSNVRVSASTLLFNIVLTNSQLRRNTKQDVLPEEDEVELCVSVLEAIAREECSAEALEGLLFSLGLLVYLLPRGGEMAELLTALDAKSTVLAKKEKFSEEPLIPEIVQLLEKALS